jgi:hypothetical protein
MDVMAINLRVWTKTVWGPGSRLSNWRYENA